MGWGLPRGSSGLLTHVQLHGIPARRRSDQRLCDFALDPNGYIVTWNSGAESLKGYRREEIIGQHRRCFYTEADQQVNRPIQLKPAREQGRVEIKGGAVRKDGSRFGPMSSLRPSRTEFLGLCQGHARLNTALGSGRPAQTHARRTREARLSVPLWRLI
jgi:PAS domain-containing protein